MRLLLPLLLTACGPTCPPSVDPVDDGASSLDVADALRALPPMRWEWSDGAETVLHVTAEPSQCARDQVRVRGDLFLDTEDGRLQDLRVWAVTTGSGVAGEVRWRVDIDRVDFEEVGDLDELVAHEDDGPDRIYTVDLAYMDLNGVGTEIGEGSLVSSGTLSLDGVDELARTWRWLGEARPLQ